MHPNLGYCNYNVHMHVCTCTLYVFMPSVCTCMYCRYANSTDCISNVGCIHVHVHTCMHVFMHRCGFTHVGSTPETRLHPGTVRKAHLQQVLSTCNLYMYMYMYMLCVQCTCTHICTIPAKVVHMHTYTRVHVHMKRLRNITIIIAGIFRGVKFL